MAELPRWFERHTDNLRGLRSIRIDLRRSLEMHRWLALGIALAGLALAAIYLLVFWPGATSPAYSLRDIFCAAGIGLLGAFLAAASAVVAHNLDPRIYIGADVEHLLGVAPLAQLPDFAEVSDEQAREHLAALAAGIAQVCPEGSVRRCVFTGTGIGTGVTTISNRTKDTLKAMGRTVLLVDAAWAPAGDAAAGGDESGSRGDSLILTDTAPLADSPDTEFLARFADCVILVVESGVTTRAQLRTAANCLQRLNLAAVGLVVNRVRVAQHGSAYREWLKERQSTAAIQSVGERKDFTHAMQRALADAPERPLPAPVPRPAAALKKPKPQPTTALTIVKRPAQPNNWTADGIPPWLSEALAQLEAAAPGVAADTERAADSVASNAPSPLPPSPEESVQKAEKRQVTQDRRASGNASRMNGGEAMLIEMNWLEPRTGTEATPQPGEMPGVSAADKIAAAMPSRLSALRGMVTAEGLKERRLGMHAQAEPGEPDRTPMPAAEVNASEGIPARLSGLRGQEAAAPFSEVSRPGEAGRERSQPGSEAARPPIPFTAQDQTPAAAAHVGEEITQPGDVPSKLPVSVEREPNGKYAEVQILPSKRGQYRRKKR